MSTQQIESPAHAKGGPGRWTTGQKWYAGGLVVLGVAITVVAFQNIWGTVTSLVAPYVRTWPWTVVVSGEIAFLFLFALGILLAWRKVPSPAARALFMGLLIAGSVLVNVWRARGVVPDMAAHLIIVCSFFAVLLTGKAAFQSLRGNKVRADRIGGAEWLAHPIRSASLQRWMATWGEPSRSVAHARYMQLLYAIAIAQADKNVGSRRFRWRRNLPVTLRYQFSMGQLPEFTGPAWQEAAAAHVREQLHPLAEAAPQHASADAPSSPESMPGTDPEGRSRARSASTSEPALRLAPSKSRSMSPSELEPHVSAMLRAYGTVSQARVKRDLHVSTEKAAEALRLAKQRRTVVPIQPENVRRKA